MRVTERNNSDRKSRKVITGLVLVLLLAFCVYKTYEEKKPELIWYDQIKDDAFSILDFQKEDVVRLELYTEEVGKKTITAHDPGIETLMESICQAELMGKSEIVLDESMGIGGDYTCFILFSLRNGDMYELHVWDADYDSENPKESVFCFQLLKNGISQGKYNSEYYGERFFFRGDVTLSFWDVYKKAG